MADVFRAPAEGALRGGQRFSGWLASRREPDRSLYPAPDEPIQFVEVTSEQGVRLLLQMQPPLDGALTQGSRVDLSYGRSLQATIRISLSNRNEVMPDRSWAWDRACWAN